MDTIHFEEKQRFKEIAFYVLLGLLQALYFRREREKNIKKMQEEVAEQDNGSDINPQRFKMQCLLTVTL